ncbi:MAG: hypothetical protein MJ221_01700 [Bacilli bacterium]|nr:hypothetical protein [Bacilli bacterium]
MKNKICALLVMPLMVGMIASCSPRRQSLNEGSNVITKKLLDANVSKEEFYSIKNSFKEIRLSDEGLDTATIQVVPNFEGMVSIQYADGKTAIYSALKQSYLLPKDKYDVISTATNQYSQPTLLYALKFDSASNPSFGKYFDRQGNLIFENTNEKIFEFVNTNSFYVKNKEGVYDLVQSYDCYFRNEKYNTHVESKFFIGNDLVKTTLDKNYDDTPFFQEEGKPYDIHQDVSSIGEYDLADYGLEGYSLLELGNKMYVYDSKRNLNNSFTIGECDSIFLLDGSILTQKTYQVDEKYENYTYTNGTSYYVVETYQYDVLTGNKSELKVDYVIDSPVYEIYDEEGKYVKYDAIDLFFISERVLSSEVQTYIIDGKGVLHNNLTGLPNLPILEKFGEYYALSSSGTVTLFDENLEPKKMVMGAIIENAGLIAYQDVFGTCGVLDEKLNVLTSGKFNNIVGRANKGNFFAEDLNGNAAFYSVNGSTVTKGLEFADTVSYALWYIDTYSGLLTVQKEATSPVEIYNLYDGEKLQFVEESSTYSYIGDISVYEKDYFVDCVGEVGFDSADKSVVLRLFNNTWTAPLK